MSQFNFTAEEDALIVTAMGVLADVQRASQGRAADDVQALIVKIAEQQTPAVAVDPVVEEVVTEVVTEEETTEEAKPAKAKKAK